MTAKLVIGIEGLDRLGKTSLIEGIQQRCGFYQVIHFGKPQTLGVYERMVDAHGEVEDPLLQYQRASFQNSMILAKSGARIIFDRWHLGECVYSPLYRGTSGDYVFNLEKRARLDKEDEIRLILLVEDFKISRHFVSDGQSFNDGQREREQELFIKAFNRSIIPDKRMICVTGPDGRFRPKEEILEEALGP